MCVVQLPSKLLVTNILAHMDGKLSFEGKDLPKEVTFDFSQIRSARPTGIVFLHNMTRHLRAAGCAVKYVGYDRESSHAMRFLDNIGFFEDHLGARQFQGSALQSTSCRLIEIHQNDCHAWASFTFIPWLSECSGIPVDNLSEIQMCVKEIFNNIQDHAGLEVGSVFAQWYPKRAVVDIAIADFGRGIPANVNRFFPDLSSSECVMKAFEHGFTTKGHPANQGAGLYWLKQNIVESLQGSINVISGGAVVRCNPADGFKEGRLRNGNHGYVGTLINLNLPTQKIERQENEIEEVVVW